MRKVAVIRVHGYYRGGNDYDSYDRESLIQSVTEFQEITDEEFVMLQCELPLLNKGDTSYMLIEQTPDTFIGKTVEAYVKRLEKEKKQRDREEMDRLARKAAAAAKKREKSEANKRKQMEKLAEELGAKIIS